VRALAVLPTYNEAGTIAEVIERSLASTPDVDLLVVDDNSPDGTGAIAEGIAAGESRVRVLHRPGKGGLGPAYLAGFAEGLASGYEVMIEMDSDLSHHPEDLPRLIEAAADADLVIGSRYVEGGATENWSPSRRLLSRAGTAYAVLRPDDLLVSLTRSTGPAPRNRFTANVVRIERGPAVAYVHVDVHGTPLVAAVMASTAEELALRAGSEVIVSVKATAIHLI